MALRIAPLAAFSAPGKILRAIICFVLKQQESPGIAPRHQ
jgi:hypothetical protein